MDSEQPYVWPESPYKGLGYYGPEDRGIFAGRECDERRCAELLALRSTRILMLHGATGCGKTSFLRAGLIPFMEQVAGGFEFLKSSGDEGVEAIFIRCTASPLIEMAHALFDFSSRILRVDTPFDSDEVDLAAIRGGIDDQDELREQWASHPHLAVESLKALAAIHPDTFVLVFDQAEEVLTLQAGEERESGRTQFFDFLDQVNNSAIDCKIVISIRTEFHGRFVSEFHRRDLDATYIREYLLDNLEGQELERAILRPTLKSAIKGFGVPFDHYGFEFEDGLAARIARDLKDAAPRGGVLAALQIVCGRLVRETRPDSAATRKAEASFESWVITASAYERMGGIEGQLDGHLDEVLSECCRRHGLSGAERREEVGLWKELLLTLARAQVDGTVTTEHRTREELAQKASELKTRLPVEPTLRELSRFRIVRPVDRFNRKERRVIRCFALGHDTIGLALSNWHEAKRHVKGVEARYRRVARRLSALLLLSSLGYAVAAIDVWQRSTAAFYVAVGWGVVFFVVGMLLWLRPEVILQPVRRLLTFPKSE